MKKIKKQVKKKAAGPSTEAHSPMYTRIMAFHREQDELHAELERNRPPLDDLVIKGLATFKGEFEYDSHDVSHYETKYEFCGSNVDLIIYPDKKGRPPDSNKQTRLKEQLWQFTKGIEPALESFPKKLRKLCKKYGLETARHQSDQSLLSNIKWINVKLESSKWIECYTNNHSISEDFDIVIRFKRRRFKKAFQARTVYFDG